MTAPRLGAPGGALPAYHEAGHAAAALMLGGIVRYVDVLAIPGERDGYCSFTVNGFGDAPLVAYAGPWAEARYRWFFDQTADFDGVLSDALLFGGGGWAGGGGSDHDLCGPFLHTHEAIWQRRLCGLWPAISVVAERLRLVQRLERDDIVRLYNSASTEPWEPDPRLCMGDVPAPAHQTRTVRALLRAPVAHAKDGGK